MFVLLVSPKGSGKSHIGRTLEKHLGVLFFHVEPLWLEYYAECQASWRQPVISESGTATLRFSSLSGFRIDLFRVLKISKPRSSRFSLDKRPRRSLLRNYP